MEAPSPTSDLERALQQNTVRDSGARAHFLTSIRELGKDGTEFTLERLQNLMRVEEHFQALLVYDQLDFLRGSSTITELERDFALNVQRICLEAANGFQRFLRTRAQWAVTQDAMAAMYRTTGLALHAIHGFVKWGCFLAEPGRTTPWRQLHALYSLAERDGYARTPFVLYPTQATYKPTVQSLYLRTLILDLLNTGSLTKSQIEIADGWFAAWCGDYDLENEPTAGRHLFCVDLESEAGLQILRTDSHGTAMRYVRADVLKMQIEELQAGLRQGRLFAGHGAGAVFPLEEHVALLAIVEKLHQSIVAGADKQIEERTHYEDREVDVALGLELALRKLREGPSKPASAPAPAAAPAPSGLALTETIELSPTGVERVAGPGGGTAQAAADDPDLNRLRVFDLSSKGYGLLVDRVTSDTVPLNGLLALRNQETGGWILGQVVRKMPARVRGEVLLGVEVLSYHPRRAELTCNAAPVESIYMPGHDSSGRGDTVLLRSGDFSSEKAFTIAAGGASYRLRMNRIIRKGPDWIQARFEIEKKN
jgi:hypothetical protein